MKRELFFALIIFVLAAGTLFGGDPPLKAVLVGDKVDLDTGTTTNMGGVSSAFNTVDNEYRVFWFDSRISGQNDVYAQRVATDGMLLGVNETISAGTPSNTDTAAGYSPMHNQYFVTWRYQNGGPGSTGFNHAYGGPVSATGGLIGAAFDVCNGGLEATMAYNTTDDQFLLEARNFAGGGPAGIRGQRVSGAGGLLGSGITLSNTGAPAPSGQVAYNPFSNRFLGTWRNQSASDLRGRIINADGTFFGAEFIISSMFPESGLAAGVAADPINDRFLVVFSEFCCGGIFLQFVSSTGSLIGSTITLVPVGPDRLSPSIAYDSVNHVFLVVWSNSTTGALEAQLLDADGNASGAGLPIPNVGSVYGPVPITADTNSGGFLLAWANHVYTTPQEHDILAQRIDVVPDAFWADADTLSASTGGVVNLTLDAGTSNAGRNYLILGSMTGTHPGTPMPGGLVTVPVNWDIFTGLVITLANSPNFPGFLGALDASGQAAAQLNWPPIPASAVGLNMSYAYALNKPWNFASYFIGVRIVP